MASKSSTPGTVFAVFSIENTVVSIIERSLLTDEAESPNHPLSKLQFVVADTAKSALVILSNQRRGASLTWFVPTPPVAKGKVIPLKADVKPTVAP